MNVLVIGAGASRATCNLPTAIGALDRWQAQIRGQHPILSLALGKWVGRNWPAENLETAWTAIDLAWKERAAGSTRPSVADLTEHERQEVWRRAFATEAAEPDESNYYRTQIAWARNEGHSTEEFLSVAAGWELRRLIQQTFRANITDEGRRLYERLLDALKPQAVISFNYDTLLEQSLPQGSWSYAGDRGAGRALQILKPHGSVNWTYRRSRLVAPAEQAQFNVSLAHDAMGYRTGWIEQNLVIGLRAKIEHTSLEQSALIRALFRDILAESEEALAAAEEICVVGYRFAPADTTFLDVVARAVARRPRVPHVSVIDYAGPSRPWTPVRNFFGAPGKLLPRIRSVFDLPVGAPLPHCFHGFVDWVDHRFCRG